MVKIHSPLIFKKNTVLNLPKNTIHTISTNEDLLQFAIVYFTLVVLP